MMETRVTRNSAALEGRIKELETKLREERAAKRDGQHGGRTSDMDSEREKMLKELVEKKSHEISELQGRMEEARESREACLEEGRLMRRKYGETIGKLEEALERIQADYNRMQEKVEKERDPNLPSRVQQLERELEELKGKNGELKGMLEECERVKRAETMKAKDLHEIVESLSESVKSLQQQVSVLMGIFHVFTFKM
jgi:chromosome segregation ATPase